jgi:hypothetical protein
MLCLLAPLLLIAAMHTPASCHEPDSLSYCSDGDALYASFLISVDAIKEGNLRDVLDEKGLEIECRLTAKVYEGRAVGGEMVDMNPLKRRLEYDDWYQEYVVNEGLPDEFRTTSYIEALERFRRFIRVKIVDLYLLEPGSPYSLSLEAEARVRDPVSSGSGGGANLAGVAAGVRDVVSDVFSGEDKPLFSVESEQEGFNSDSLPSPLSRCLEGTQR